MKDNECMAPFVRLRVRFARCGGCANASAGGIFCDRHRRFCDIMDCLDAVAAALSGHQVSGIERRLKQNFSRQIPGGKVMQELINSFVRLSAAMSVYSMQQMQSAVETIDPKDSVTKLKKMIDSMTDALTAQIDDSKKQTVDSISNLGADVVGRTFDTLNVSALHPSELVQTTNDLVRKTTDSLASIIKPDKTAGRKAKKASDSTPRPAEEVLAV